MGFSASQSKSETSNLNQQLSTQGASGQQSPTITSAGNVTYEDAGGQVSLAALAGMDNVVNLALSKQNDLNTAELQLLSGSLSDQAKASASASDQSTQLLSSILAQNSQLAQNAQTGGATAAVKQTNYIILAALAFAGAVLWFLAKHK
jgi:hypothetical protein